MGEISSVATTRCHSFTLYQGTFIQLPREPTAPATSTTAPAYELLVNNGVVWVDNSDGRIAGFDWAVSGQEGLDELAANMGWTLVYNDNEVESTQATVVRVIRSRAEKNGFFFPGFIDTHIHAPQYPNSGIFGSTTLLDWLNKYTFPMEASFGDKNAPDTPTRRAYTVYNAVVARTLSHGTTSAAYYATVHVPATNLLASVCHSRGQRAFIGRVCMDNPDTCPDFYRDESTAAMVDATKASMAYIHRLDPSGTLVKPIITPRFAISCTSEGLAQLGELAASTSPPTHIQTHISENDDEIQTVKALFPDCSTYAEVYDRAKLITPRTILAHGVHLQQSERALIRERRAGISHCPTSNSSLSSGMCPVRVLLDDGLNVGLGTDVSGGYSPSILETARQASLVSRLVACHCSKENGNRNKLSVEEALYLATRGGAKVFNMQDEIGGFEKGMFWDAQMVELGDSIESDTDGIVTPEQLDLQHSGKVCVFGWESWEERIAKWMWTGDDRNVKAVWVGGRLVHGST
ncbi:Guanine deaminase [Trichophyton interdigitale]|uniref:Probable guanine deaminase n=1 Tax=Trichophyton interdigitale TaxID=101480 RepID=A0A9P4YJY7_9EURO|nr:Guanine deaminase [Trichophyton interdigitale]KAF3900410.1 Guanine deaminase [Trichophyton interdigitale]KAG8211255.1 Guanine deaminase [Trichophyton interdigitale]